jgi:hypothetical protein
MVVTATRGGDFALWSTDGTPAGTAPITSLGPKDGAFLPARELVVAADRLFYAGYSRETGVELWALRQQ